jgi:hypothetical protein
LISSTLIWSTKNWSTKNPGQVKRAMNSAVFSAKGFEPCLLLYLRPWLMHACNSVARYVTAFVGAGLVFNPCYCITVKKWYIVLETFIYAKIGIQFDWTVSVHSSITLLPT